MTRLEALEIIENIVGEFELLGMDAETIFDDDFIGAEIPITNCVDGTTALLSIGANDPTGTGNWVPGVWYELTK